MTSTTQADGLAITPHEAPHLAETAYVRFAELVGTVRADQWGAAHRLRGLDGPRPHRPHGRRDAVGRVAA